jgi:dTDP-L-rhamnose 4-epimerase
VTGGAGFIGCAISGPLTRHFRRVCAIDNLHPQVHRGRRRPPRLAPGVELITADVTRAETWDAVLADWHPGVIIHLAAETGTAQSLTEATRHAHTNVVGTSQMLDALRRHDRLPARIVLTSSRAVYGEGAWRDNATRSIVHPGQRSLDQLGRAEWDFKGCSPMPFAAATTVPNPTSVYGATKLAQEHLLRAWTSSFGVGLLTLRLQNVYGPGQSLDNSYAGIAAAFARLARNGASIPVYEDGKMRRDFVYIDDVADAILRAATAGEPAAMAYDIGSGVTTTVGELARIIAGHYGAPAPHVSGAFRKGDIRHASCDIARSLRELGWTPRWRLEDGLGMLCAWVDEQKPEARAGSDTVPTADR